MDPLFTAKTLAATPNPNQIIYLALHQDYSSDFVCDFPPPSEDKCGEIVINRLLKVSHFGPLEHGQITICFGFFPHSVMQQVRTHRGEVAGDITFDVQSFRYTGNSIKLLGDTVSQQAMGVDFNDFKELNKLFYIRPIGEYRDRNGDTYYQSEKSQKDQKNQLFSQVRFYAQNVSNGMPHEMARGFIAFDIRQHFIMSVNTRTVMHLLDMRYKKDAQLECQQWAQLLFDEFKKWNPILANWYEQKRLGRGRLAP